MKQTLIFLVLIVVFLVSCASSGVQTTHPPSIDPGIDTDAWALIPAGEFLMGLHEHETNLDYNYEIMLTDVTNAQFANYLN